MPVPVGLPVTVPVTGSGGAIVMVQDALITGFPTTYRISNYGPSSIVVQTGGGSVRFFAASQWCRG